MNYRNIFLLTLGLLLSLAVHAQKLTVESMQVTNDLSASQHRQADRNNEPCGLVKVSLATVGATFEGNVIQPVEYKTGEYWVYMTKGSRELRIKHPNFVPLHVKFADYGIKDIQSLTTYNLTIIMPQIGQAVDDGMRYLAMTVEPANAMVYVDNNLQPLQNGTLSMLLSMGQHQYRAEAPGYEPKSGSFTIGDETLQLPVKLESAMASLSISTTTQGTQIYVNDQLRGTSSWNGTLPPGSYRIEGRLQGYRNHRQNITLAQRDRQQFTIPALQAITGVLNVNYQPLNTEVWIDGKKVGTSPSIFRNILVGSHTVELRAAGYVSKQEKVTIEEGHTAQIVGSLNKILTDSHSQSASSFQLPSIPVDPDVRIGKLNNGLTYYIRHNAWPEQRAEFYIAQRVGSIQEDDNQRGLAHFLEHMAFNGSKHFKGNDLLSWCESIGVKFGTDLNAYTAIDQTVYNISNVPTTRETIIDSCLLILYDWADGLLLEQEEIEKERGVIHEEMRLRTSAQMRMLERNLPKLYPNSKYGHRMPIGLMEIIDNFERPFLQAYYKKWYRPDNQAIIVVGDVNVDLVEQKIKSLFSPIVVPENRALVTTYPVPDNNEAIFVIDKDKEQRYNIVEVLMKHEAFPDSQKGNLTYIFANYMKDAAMSMLNDRLKVFAEKPECPFLQASVGDGNYLLSRGVDAFNMAILPKDGQTEAAVKAVLTEARRAAESGFTPTEYDRYKASYFSSLDKQYSNKDKRYNSQFVSQYVQHFLNNEPIPSIDYTYTTMKQLVPQLPLEGINALMKELVSQSDTNLVVLNFNTEKEGVVYPTETSLKKAIVKARK